MRTSKRPGGFRRSIQVFKYRNYRLYFSGQLVSTTGTYMQSVALAWLIYAQTKSPVLLGVVAFASQMPVFILAPFSGILADRMPRQRVVITCESLSLLLSLALTVLTFAHRIGIWEILVIATVMGVLNAFNFPARQAFMADIVPKADLIHAIPLNSSMINAARIVGPAIAGVLVAAIGEGWCFAINTSSYAAVVVALLLIKVQSHKMTAHARSVFANIREGFAFAVSNGPDLALLLLLGVVSFWGMRFDVLLPVFADKVLTEGPAALGILMGATGIGAVLGSLVLAARSNVRELGAWIAFAALGFGGALILFAISRSLWLCAGLLVAAGFAMVAQLDSSNTLLQETVPDDLRGRITSIWTMMLTGMGPFGSLVIGALAGRFGATRTLAAGGTACAMGAIVFGFYLPIFSRRAMESIGSDCETEVSEAGGPLTLFEKTGALASPGEDQGDRRGEHQCSRRPTADVSK
ncbi:MAG: MFS transporter [Blastocatellia bacterium]